MKNDQNRLWPDSYSHLDATLISEAPEHITLDGPSVPTAQHALVELSSLYKRLDFGSSADQDGTFEVLRIELPFLFDRAKRYIGLLQRLLEQRPRTITNIKL